MLSKRYESTEVERRSWLLLPSGKLWFNSSVTHVTKWLKWCVHARYMKVLSVTFSTFKRRMEKKLGERREKWGAMYRLEVSFWDCFTVKLGGLMLLYYMEGVLEEYVQKQKRSTEGCLELWSILTNLDEKLCLQDSSFSWLLGTGMVLKL